MSGAAVDFDPFAGAALEGSAPSTESQRELWLASQIGDDASCAFNESLTLELRGALDASALKQSLVDLLHAHEALRGCYADDGTLFVVTETVLDLEELDWSGLSAEGQGEQWRALLTREVGTPFDLARGPLARFRLVRRNEELHQLVVTAHHSVCDGWSFGVILEDLGRAYSAKRRDERNPLRNRPRYGDYARNEWEEASGPDHAASLRFWTARFAEEPPVLDLPSDRPRGRRRSHASAREDRELDAGLIEQVRGFASEQRASFTSTLLAGFKVLLAGLSGQRDVVVGVPAAGQSLAGEELLVGHCVRMLPMRSRLDWEQGFAQAVRDVQTTVLDSYEHHHVTFGALLKHLALRRDPARLPLTDVLFNVEQAGGEGVDFEGLAARWHSNPRSFENFDLFLNIVEGDDGVRLELQYNTDLYDRATVLRWLDHFEAILEQGVREPQRALASRARISESDARLLESWNDRDTPRPEPATLTALLEQGLAASAERVALRCGDESLSHAELHARARRLARALAARGVGRGAVVGLCLERGTELLVALLGILKAGAAYLPLDPELPPRRIAAMLEDSGAGWVVTREALGERLPQGPQRLCLDREREELESASSEPFDAGVGPDDLAYLIYTSGSTGRPKGVEVPHSCVAHFLWSMAERPGLGADDRLLAVTTLGFDISVLELLLPLAVGARVVLASADEVADPSRLAELLEEQEISVMQATPSRFRLLLASGWKGASRLRILCGGEALSPDLAAELLPRCAELWNLYGPTETTVWSTVQRVADAAAPLPIGRPISNTRCYVLDERLAPLPPGVAGELYIGGAGVTRGYRGLPELTRQRFVPDPFASGEAADGARLYRTGDLARFRSDGALEYLGRDDFQVKVRGYRIETGEVERTLADCPAVAQAVVVARDFGPDDRRLVAYYQTRGPEAEVAELRRALRDSLPEYMVPQHFVRLETFPLTANGKVDRKRLPQPESDAGASPGAEGTGGGLEARLGKIFCEVLGVESLAPDRDFFEAGGHSLLAARVLARAGAELGLQLPLTLLFEHPSVARLASHLAAGGVTAPAPRLERRREPGPAPLSRMQERVWFAEQLSPGTTLFHIPMGWRLRGELDAAALQGAIDAFTRRQEVTRSVFAWSGERAVQEIRDLAFPLERRDLRPLPEAERRAELARLLEEETRRPFDLACGPLLRFGLYRLDDSEHALFAVAHHAIWDGGSTDIFFRELASLYHSLSRGEPSRPEPLPVGYGDFAAWHREWLEGDELRRQSQYWTEQLSGEIEPLALPTDRPRPERFSHASSTLRFEIPADQVRALREVAERHDATLYMLMLAALKALLHGRTGQTDLCVGSPIGGRSWQEVQDTVGFFVNAQVLRTRVEPQAPFTELLAAVRRSCLGAFAHPDMPFDLLVQELGVPRELSATPLYQVLFTFVDRRERSPRFGDLECEELPVEAGASPTEIGLWMEEHGDGIRAGLEYATALYRRDTAFGWVEEYRRILGEIAGDPEAPVERIAGSRSEGLGERLRRRFARSR